MAAARLLLLLLVVVASAVVVPSAAAFAFPTTSSGISRRRSGGSSSSGSVLVIQGRRAQDARRVGGGRLPQPSPSSGLASSSRPIAESSSAGDAAAPATSEHEASVLHGLVLPASLASLWGTAAVAIRAALLSPHAYGPLGGLGALTAVASVVLVPLAQVRNLYAISVGYGTSVGVLGMLLRRTFDPLKESLGHTLSGCTVFYGFRLAAYLYTRERAGWKPSATTNRKEPARLRRVPFSLTLAFFYACLTMPVLHVLRASPSLAYQSWRWYVAWAGTVAAWAGAVLEAVADTHKFMVKNSSNNQEEGGDGEDDDAAAAAAEFVGPVSGAYALTRHPNYTGEVLHWCGTYLAGAACFGSSWVGWVSSTLGLYGIVSIMVAATKGLERRQRDKYLGDPAYENWKARVPYPLIPFVRGPEAPSEEGAAA